jgi:RNA-binding protein
LWKPATAGCELSSQNQARTRRNDINHLPRLREEETISYIEGTTFEKNKLKYLQSRSRRTDPTIWIGKEGLTEELLTHVENQLKARELVKLKVQKAALTDTDTITLAEKVSKSTSSILVEAMGHTFTLYKKREATKTKSDSEHSH